jgi:hypothetical protein
MLHQAIATLRDTLRPHLGLSKDRVETLALIVIAMVSARTVNLSHLAAERPGATLATSCPMARPRSSTARTWPPSRW